MTNPPLPKAIFFDWDGTLVDSYQLLLEAHNYARERIGLPVFSYEGFKPYFGKPRDYLYQAIYGDDQEAARAYFEEFVVKNHVDYLNPVEGAQALLETVEKLGITAGVVSNKKGAFIRQEITHYGWDKYFSVILGSGEAAEDKPSSAPLVMAIEKTKLSLDYLDYKDIWYVGDTDIDMLCAENTGVQAILVHEQGTQSDLAKQYNPLMAIENCFILEQFLLQCAEK